MGYITNHYVIRYTAWNIIKFSWRSRKKKYIWVNTWAQWFWSSLGHIYFWFGFKCINWPILFQPCYAQKILSFFFRRLIFVRTKKNKRILTNDSFLKIWNNECIFKERELNFKNRRKKGILTIGNKEQPNKNRNVKRKNISQSLSEPCDIKLNWNCWLIKFLLNNSCNFFLHVSVIVLVIG